MTHKVAPWWQPSVIHRVGSHVGGDPSLALLRVADDAHHCEVGIVGMHLVKGLQRGELFVTRDAPGIPEVDDDRLTGELVTRDAVAVERRETERGCVAPH